MLLHSHMPVWSLKRVFKNDQPWWGMYYYVEYVSSLFFNFYFYNILVWFNTLKYLPISLGIMTPKLIDGDFTQVPVPQIILGSSLLLSQGCTFFRFFFGFLLYPAQNTFFWVQICAARPTVFKTLYWSSRSLLDIVQFFPRKRSIRDLNTQNLLFNKCFTIII